MPQPNTKTKYRPLPAALLTLVVLLASTLLIWLAVVRPQLGKGRTETLCDNFDRSELLADGDTAAQVFTYDKALYTIGLEFYLPGAQPQGELEVVLSDADTGEELARSTGVMQNIIPDQYTTLGLDPVVPAQEGRRYRLSVTAHYTSDAFLAIGHSNGVALWKEQMTLNGEPVDGTLAMQVTYQRMGGYLTRFFLLAGGAAALLAAFAVYACLSRKVSLHRLVFVLVLGFGLIYSVILPPYAAPDEKYHINQSFTLATKWANMISHDDWQMGKVPTTTSFRRETDTDELLQDENTTVFTWQEFTDTLFTTTDAPYTSHQEYHELQTDQNPLLYLASGGAVFLAYLLHLGFTPALALGRLANLIVFALLAAFAVKAAPCGKRIFTAAALLPMTLHLAASFSRDAVLLGLCFGFTALLLDAVYGQPTPKHMAALAVAGILLAPGKMVYLPLATLFVLVPAAALGHHAKAKKLGYLAACLALALVLNTGTLTGALGSPASDTRDPAQSEVDFWVQALAEGDVTPAVLGQSFIFTTNKANSYTDAQAFYTMASYALLGTDVTTGNADAYLPYFAEGGAMQAYKQLFNLPTCVERFAALGLDVGTMDDRIPLDRETVAAEVEAARATRATQSVTDAADEATYTPGYILHHLPATALLFVRSIVQNGDHYLRTLVGGSLSYYTLDLAWFWVVALYLLLAYAALPAQNGKLPTGRLRGFGAAAAVLSCLLAVAGCLLWTPTHYETLYGLQGRYFLPVLPALLLTCLPRRLAAVPDEASAQARLTGALALVQWGVILNIMLAVIAR